MKEKCPVGRQQRPMERGMCCRRAGLEHEKGMVGDKVLFWRRGGAWPGSISGDPEDPSPIVQPRTGEKKAVGRKETLLQKWQEGAKELAQRAPHLLGERIPRVHSQLYKVS